MKTPVDRVEDIKNAINWSMPKTAIVRISNSGVPHVVGTLPDNQQYSVAFFGKTRTYRVFLPYWSADQKKFDFKTTSAVVKFIEELS